MRVDFQQYRSQKRSLGLRAAALLVLSGCILLFGLFWAGIGSIGAFAPQQDSDVAVGIGVIVVAGVFPALVGLLAGYFGFHYLRRMSRIEQLALLVQKGGSPNTQAVASVLKISVADAESLVFDACTKGVVVDGAEPPSGFGAPPGVPEMQQVWSPQAAVAPTVAGITPDRFEDTADKDPLWHSEMDGPFSAQGVASPRQTLAGILLNDTYEMEELLGEGGMGAVYVGRHVRTGRRYAVKVLLPDARFSDDAIKRFKREAAAASALGHRGIISIHDFDVTPDGMHYLVSELLQGETLDERIERQKTLPWREAAAIIRETGVALQAAHEAGILHRDLKPGNVFLARDGAGDERVVLLDFGLAKPLDDAGASKITTTGVVVGTPLYMSPEQACSERLDVRSDVYALGAMLYELLTGEPPFLAATVAGVYARLLNEQPTRPSQSAPHPLPVDADELLERALAKDADERFQTVNAFLGALGEIMRKTPAIGDQGMGRAG